MRSIVNLFILLTTLCLIATGCKKEEALTPSTEKENIYGDFTLPQGNHPYDADIVKLFQQYNTMFLYKYVPNDLYYQINQYTGGTYNATKDSTTVGGYFDVPADQAYISQQLALLKDSWLKFYPDEFLKNGLPQKVFLLDSFYFAWAGNGKPFNNWPEFYEVYQGQDFFAVTWGGPRITTITQAEKYSFKSTLNTKFLSIAYKKGLIRRSAAFTALTNYTALTYSNFQELGVIDWYRRTPDEDWNVFMETIVSNTYAQLTAPGGILHPGTDTGGLIRKKYDIVIAYFKSAFGIDLQVIGDAQ